MDVCSMPETTWKGEKFDAFLLVVDRESGWMVARPTQNEGLTGDKAAHMLLDGCWGEFGVPHIITSDQGPQFISQWWQTMCARLGIRMAYSHAYHSQANGRAEVASRVIKDILRKLNYDKGQNWVEALPRVLRIQHDMVDPVTGYSPYNAVFGRDRPLAGLPWTPENIVYEAEEFFEHMNDLDNKIAEKLQEAHDKVTERVNANRKARKPISEGDWVWIARPKPIGGVKLMTWWRGPYRVIERQGDASYVVKTPQGEKIPVHATQMKKCTWETLGVPKYKLVYPTDAKTDHEDSDSEMDDSD